MNDPQTVRLRAHAKLNLALRVGPPGDDGFHPLATVFQTISLADHLYGRHNPEPTELLELTVGGAELPDDNTVRRAIELLVGHLRAGGIEPQPLCLHLEKRIPSGAGLGGGSSDAVAALAACLRLWDVERQWVETADIAAIAAEVGSDVPFFLSGGTALGLGRGDRIEPLAALRSTWFCVASPRIHVSTPAAYAAFDELSAADGGTEAGGGGGVAGAASGSAADHAAVPTAPDYRPELDAAWMGNDLAAAVREAHPEVEEVRRALLDAGARPAQMTGSGAASFGAFDGRRAAQNAAKTLQAKGYWAAAVVSVDRRQHLRALWAGEAPDSFR